MRQYAKNVLRGAGKNWIQYGGTVLIIALAVTVFIGLYDYAKNLRENAIPYFHAYDYADLFADVDGITESELESLMDIEGVSAVFGRQTADVRLETDEDRIVMLHLLAYTPEDTLNRIGLSTDDGTIGSTEICCSQAMQNKRQFSQGEALSVVYHGVRTELTYAGTAICPQYIYYVPSSDIQAPIDDLYAFAAVDKDRLAQITGQSGVVNEVGIRLDAGADPRIMKNLVEERLKEMGDVIYITTGEKQDAYDTMISEIETFEIVSYIIPVLFLAGAAFMVYIILKKAIDNERTVIGTLKAMGATNTEILKIYLQFSAVIGLAGSVIAMFCAYPIGSYLLIDSATYYSLPNVTYHFFLTPRLIGLLFGVGTGMLSAWLGVRDAVSIQPSESMRPAAPKVGRTLNLPEWLQKCLNSRQSIAVRAIFRNPFRTAVIAFSISFPIALITCAFALGTYVSDSSDKTVQLQEAGDCKLVLSGNASPESVRREVLSLDHVVDAEPAASFFVNLRAGNHTALCNMVAYDPAGGLLNVIDNRNRVLTPPEDAILLDLQTARKLGVQEGDLITLQESAFGREEIRLPVGAVFDTYNGFHAWMTMDTFCRVFDQEPTANIVLCSVERDHKADFLHILRDASNIAYIVDNERALEEYRVMNAPVIVISYLVAAFAILSGGVMIYGIISMNLRERKTEFGTLMVLGMRRGEILEMIVLEQVFAMIAGVAMTAGLMPVMKALFDMAMEDEKYVCDLAIRPADYLLALMGCVLVTLFSMFSGYREMTGMDLTDVLKERS
ncbi:MAG: ABC transporter permease [Lachnospiraceae bacterium]|nr:ABC transporter permease [Lachnospiraceae bacterium]